MDLKSLYREIVNEHNLHPGHKGDLPAPTHIRQGVNPTCGDDINLQLTLDKEGVITEASFNGSGCAVSQASVSLMIDDILGKPIEEARRLIGLFLGMVKGTVRPDEIDDLEDAAALQGIAHTPARTKCAVLAWHTLEEALSGKTES